MANVHKEQKTTQEKFTPSVKSPGGGVAKEATSKFHGKTEKLVHTPGKNTNME